MNDQVCKSTWEGALGPCIVRGEHRVHDDGSGAQWADGASTAPERGGHMIYAARQDGWPGYVAVCVDDPVWKKDTAKHIASWVRKGYTVERVTREQSVEGLKEYAAEQKRRKSESETQRVQEDGAQIGMFA